MRITDYGTVSCWQERNLLARIDRELRTKQQNENKPVDKDDKAGDKI